MLRENKVRKQKLYYVRKHKDSFAMIRQAESHADVGAASDGAGTGGAEADHAAAGASGKAAKRPDAKPRAAKPAAGARSGKA